MARVIGGSRRTMILPSHPTLFQNCIGAMAMEERILKLERRCRFLTMAIVVLVVGTACMGAAGRSEKFERIFAKQALVKQLLITDDDVKTRIEMTVSDGVAMLKFLQKDENADPHFL